MVRLKVKEGNNTKNERNKFQFQYGTIKREVELWREWFK